MPHTVSLFLIHSTNKRELAYGTTNPTLDSSNLIHGTKIVPFLSEFYKYANHSNTAFNSSDQIKASKVETKMKKEKVSDHQEKDTVSK